MPRKECPTCAHRWMDKYGKNECPKCLSPLVGTTTAGRQIHTDAAQGVSTRRLTPGEASTNKQSASSAMESMSGSCSMGGSHLWKFGKCSKCGMAEGGNASAPTQRAKLNGRAQKAALDRDIAHVQASFESTRRPVLMDRDCPKGGKHMYKFGKCSKCKRIEHA